MLYAEKGNKVKEINDSQIESCVEQGYRIVDETGKVVRETVPTDIASLKLAYAQHEKIIREQKEKILELEDMVKELKSAKQEKATDSLGTAKTKRGTKSATE